MTYDAELNELVFYPVEEVQKLRNETLYQDTVTLNQVWSQTSILLVLHQHV